MQYLNQDETLQHKSHICQNVYRTLHFGPNELWQSHNCHNKNCQKHSCHNSNIFTTKTDKNTIVATINIACLPSPKPQVVPQGSVPSSKGIPEQAQDAILSMILNKHKIIMILMTQPFDVRAPLCL